MSLSLVDLDDAKTRTSAERIIAGEVSAVGQNPSVVKGNGCTACHVLFTIKDRMGLSEADAADLLTEVLLASPGLNDSFIEMVENMPIRIM